MNFAGKKTKQLFNGTPLGLVAAFKGASLTVASALGFG